MNVKVMFFIKQQHTHNKNVAVNNTEYFSDSIDMYCTFCIY